MYINRLEDLPAGTVIHGQDRLSGLMVRYGAELRAEQERRQEEARKLAQASVKPRRPVMRRLKLWTIVNKEDK